MSSNTSPTPSESGRWVITEFGGPSVLKWQLFPSNSLPVPGPSTALIRVLISGVSGADNIMRAGGYTRFPLTREPGFTPGYDLIGVIEAIGEPDESSRPSAFKVGDIVASITVVGGYATHTVVPLDDCLKLEKGDDLVKMAALPVNYMTAYGMLTLSAFPVSSSTHSVLIGSVAGGVGTALAQVARLLFPDLKLFGTCSPSKFDYVRSLGVTPVDRTMPAADFAARVRELNSGAGVDVAYEMLGSEENMLAFLDCTKAETGKLVAIGFIANVRTDGLGTAAETFDPIAFTQRRADRMSFFSVTNHYWKGQRDRFRADFEGVLVRAVREGRLDPVVGSLWRLSDAVKINEMLATGQGITGKLEMLVDQEVWDKYAEHK